MPSRTTAFPRPPSSTWTGRSARRHFDITLLPRSARSRTRTRLGLGPGSSFLNGLKDRSAHLFRMESSVSLHVLFGLATVSLVLARLVWLTATGEAMFASRRRFFFAALAILGVWILFAGTQVGG